MGLGKVCTAPVVSGSWEEMKEEVYGRNTSLEQGFPYTAAGRAQDGMLLFAD